MRLIDAEAAKEFLRENLILQDESDEKIVETMIDAVPTAYDIDAVVRELKKIKAINVDVGFGTIYKTVRKDVAIEIVKQGGISDDVQIVQGVAEEYKDGWIPIDEKLPPDDSFILLSFSNFSIPIVGRYEEDEGGGGNFFAGDEDEPLISQDMYVNAWMPLPKPYEEE